MLHLFVGFLLTVFVIVCLLLILVILMQRSKQDGLGAAFGGGLTETVFGAQTSNILVRITSWLVALFFFLAIALAYFYGRSHKSAIHEHLLPAAVPAAAAVPASASADASPATNAPVSTPAPAAAK